MKTTSLIIIILFFSSCIPTKIAPKIETHKIAVAKKFKRTLPKQHAFIFEDPKDANEFYNYINTKFQLEHKEVSHNVEISINNKPYYLSFYETSRDTKTVNLVPIIVDAKKEQNGNDPMFEDAHVSRKGKYYLVLTVFDDKVNNCLAENYTKRNAVIKYLETMRKEYLTTHNYEQLLFKKKS